MAAPPIRRPFASAAALAAALFSSVHSAPLAQSQPSANSRPIAPPIEALDARPDFARLQREQAETDEAWREASAGFMQMEKVQYRSSAGDLDVPAFVFQPLQTHGPKAHPALVWVHENIRGHLYEHYIPYVREATARGFVVVAPEYRGSIGYGRRFYDAIDYGGAEVNDVVTAAAMLAVRYPAVDPSRIGIVGWSHGGLIALLSTFRNPRTFKAVAAIAPVTNLFHRLARKGVDRQRRAIDPQNRFGGSPSERPEIYKERSPLFHVDRLQVPLLLHVAENDEDVNIDESMQLVDALRARKASLADIKIYRNPPGGHTFDRRINPLTHQPENLPDQRDSWDRLWRFFEVNLSAVN